jgi:carbonic anhydrase
MSEELTLPPVKLAIINNESAVIDVLHTDERLAAILLSNPIIKDVTDMNVVETVLGWMYDYESGQISPQTNSDGPGMAEI